MELRIAVKSKEISCKLEPVRNSYITIIHQPVTVSSDTCSQVHVQIKPSLAHLQHQDTWLCASGQDSHVEHKCVIYRNH